MESSSTALKELTLESVKAEIYARNNPTLTPVDIELHAEVVYRILELKKKHNAVILVIITWNLWFLAFLSRVNKAIHLH